MGDSRLISRNVTAVSGRTSIRLEPELWSALEEMCHREGITLAETIQRIESQRIQAQRLDGLDSDLAGRTSAVRVHIINYYRAATTDRGHLLAGHGALNQLVD